MKYIVKSVAILSCAQLFMACNANVEQFVRGAVASQKIGPSANTVLAMTAPTADSVVSSSAVSFKWVTSGAAPRAVNSFQINTYTQANCKGSVLSTSLTSSTQYSLSGIIDSGIYSVGVSAFDASGVRSSEVCSYSVQATAVVAKLQVPGAAYLSVEVDHSNHLAYLGANYGTTFFDTIDLNDENNPVLFRSIGSASTPSTASTYSRGTAIYNGGQRLLVASNGASTLELWDLTNNPRIGSWTKLASLGGLSQLKKIVKVDTNNPLVTVVYVALRGGMAIVNIAEPAGTMSLVSSVGSLTQVQSGAIVGNWMLTSSASDNNAYLINLTSLATDATYNFPDPGMGVFLWSGSTSADGKKVYCGGVVGGFFTYNTATPAVPPVMTYKFNNLSNALGRDATFTVENAKDMLYSIRNLGTVDAWDTTNMAAPVLAKSFAIANFTAEAYGIRVNPTTHRAYISTSSGFFYIINTDLMPAPLVQPLSY